MSGRKILTQGVNAGLLAAMITIAATSCALAQTAEQFYTNRTISIIVPYGPGGYYDIGARLIARHWSKHIVGHPNIVVQNQPSTGGIGLAARFAKGAYNDGTQLGVLQRAVPQYAFVGYQSANFDPLKLSWIGSLSSYANDTYLMILNANHPVKTVDELRTTSVKTRLGAGRSGSANLIYALLAKDLLKINVDIVRGYEGTAPIFLAQQRGEVDGVFADLSTIEVAAAAQWKDKQVVPVVQFGRKARLAEVPNVPTARELVKDPKDLAFLDFAELPFYIALPLAGPSGMPVDRKKALMDGFMAMAADPEFLADAKKLNFEVSPISGDTVAQAIQKASDASSDVKKRFLKLVSD